MTTLLKPISELPALAEPGITDILAIVNGGATKKIELQNLFKAVAGLTEVTTPASTDVLAIVGASGAQKITLANIFKNVPAGSVSDPGLKLGAGAGLTQSAGNILDIVLGSPLALEYSFSASALNLLGNYLIGTNAAAGALFLKPTSHGTPTGNSTFIGNSQEIYFIGNSINAYWAFDADTGGLDINYRGFSSGVTRFRNLTIYDGKGNQLSKWTGSSALLSHSVDMAMAAGKRFRPGAVTYTTSMNADVAGTIQDIVYCTTDNKVYVCTATGGAGAATWAALN